MSICLAKINVTTYLSAGISMGGSMDILFRKLFGDHFRMTPTPNMVAAVVDSRKVLHHVEFNLPQYSFPTSSLSTQFRIASMTKPFVAISLLQLRDSGKLDLNHKIKRYIPWLNQDWEQVTLEHALTMRSGFSVDDPWADRTLNQTNQEIEPCIHSALPVYKAGEHFQYSNLGYMLLGKVVSEVSELSLAEYMTRNIFEPLSMHKTGFNFLEGLHSVKGYETHNSDAGIFQESTQFNIDNDYAGFGGLCSTIEDLQKFIGFYLDDDNRKYLKVLSVQSRKEAQSFGWVKDLNDWSQEIRSPLAESYGYGLRNFAYNSEIFSGHAGGIPGFNSFMLWSRKHQVGIIALNNATAPNVWSLCLDWMKAYSLDSTLRTANIKVGHLVIRRGNQLLELIRQWDEKLVRSVFADNVFLDYNMAELKRNLSVLDVAVLSAEWDRHLCGVIHRLESSKKYIEVSFSLSPVSEHKIQSIVFR